MARTLSLPALAGGASDAVLLALDITAMILTGQLRSGDPVPGDEEHAARTGAREHDARAAKVLLKQLGLITRPPQGRHYLVAPPAAAPHRSMPRVMTTANDSPAGAREAAPHHEEEMPPMPDAAVRAGGVTPAGPSPRDGGRATRPPNG